MKKIPINLSDISDISEAMTMFDTLSESAGYLDRKTGEVIFHFDPMISGCDNEIDPSKDEERYLFIEPLDSHSSFRIMENYTNDLDEGPAKTALTRDLSRSRPFRNFKETLNQFPKLLDTYFNYHEAEVQKIAQSFLERNEIEVSPKQGA